MGEGEKGGEVGKNGSRNEGVRRQKWEGERRREMERMEKERKGKRRERKRKREGAEGKKIEEGDEIGVDVYGRGLENRGEKSDGRRRT
jgi:hypothetical protein